MPNADDIDRLRKVYQERSNQPKQTERYSYLNKPHLFTIQQRERHLLQALSKNRVPKLTDLKILDIGCGSGGILLDLVKYGAESHKLAGVDLLYDRLQAARLRLSSSRLINSDAQRLPFQSGYFNLVTQFTAFSSILDVSMKKAMAFEMLRVLDEDGVIIWYDFWWNPSNRQTAGINRSEIKTLFPGCDIYCRKITLAPPIARKIVPISWLFGMLLESLGIFNSHYLALIRKK